MACMIMASTKSFINLVPPIPAPKATPSPKTRLPTFPKPLQLPFSLDERGGAIREKLSSVRDTAADENQSRILLKMSEPSPDFRILEVPSSGCLKFLLMCGIFTLQTTEQALAGSEISTSLQPFSFLGDLGDISTGFASVSNFSLQLELLLGFKHITRTLKKT